MVKEENYELLKEQRKYAKSLARMHFTLTVRMDPHFLDQDRIKSLAGRTAEELGKMERNFDSEIKRMARALHEIEAAKVLRKVDKKKEYEKPAEGVDQKWVRIASRVHAITGPGNFSSGEFCRLLNASPDNPFPGINTSIGKPINYQKLLTALAHNDTRFKLKRALVDSSAILRWSIEIK